MSEQEQSFNTLLIQYIKNGQPSNCSQELLDAVAKVLFAEMNRRKLWNKPPAWLGYGWDHWNV